jgi:hypothetical protein
MGSHFNGRGVLEHLKDARKKGHLASSEPHGIEAQGHLIGGADSAREVALIALLLSIPLIIPYSIIALVVTGFVFWKVGRSASLAWSRLERINKLIIDEKQEIETNRDEEKSELTEMYRAKGFSEPLLTKVIDVLMADDNKLLGIMLEEELGVSLESYEHPLKQAMGTAIGSILAVSLLFASFLLLGQSGIFFAAPLIILIASAFMAKISQIRILHAAVWNLAITFMSAMTTYFLAQFFTNL